MLFLQCAPDPGILRVLSTVQHEERWRRPEKKRGHAPREVDPTSTDELEAEMEEIAKEVRGNALSLAKLSYFTISRSILFVRIDPFRR